MYTVCYVLADSEQLLFYNEMMISIISLRYYGYEGPVCIITDQITNMFLENYVEDLEKYRLRVIVVDVPEHYNNKEKSRYLKTSLRSYVSGDFLFVDADTVFADKLPSHISDQEIAMVTDHHYAKLMVNSPTYQYALPRAQKSGMELMVGEAYFNSGILWVRDTEKTRILFNIWHKEWKNSCKQGIAEDQLSLNAVNHRLGSLISRLDDCYNVQISDGETIPFSLLGKSIIIHYFHPGRGNREYKLSIPEIRQTHYESATIREIIKSPKTAFVDGKIISSESYAEMKNLSGTMLYQVLKKLYFHKRLFGFFETAIKKIVQARQFFQRTTK